MDLKDERFLSWLRANGASIEKVEWPSYRTVGGVRGTVAVADIATNEPIFEIPHRLMMSPAHASESPEIGGIICTEKDVLVGDLPVVLFIMHERGKGEGSFWHPYLDSLPQPLNICHWSEEALAELQDTRLAQRARLRTSRLKMVHQRIFVKTLAPAHPDIFGGGGGGDPAASPAPPLLIPFDPRTSTKRRRRTLLRDRLRRSSKAEGVAEVARPGTTISRPIRAPPTRARAPGGRSRPSSSRGTPCRRARSGGACRGRPSCPSRTC